MGSEEGDEDERPVHFVTLSTFRISKTEVTVAQYAACVAAGKCTVPDTGGACNWELAGRENHPINCVDWEQAKAFTVWLSGVMGQEVRLPSEAQWEYAARGPESRTYPWGQAAPTSELANFGGLIGHTTPVGQYPKGASWVGALDMAGNVWEWCLDIWHDSYKGAPSDGSEWMIGDDFEQRLVRGGSWSGHAGRLRGADRVWVLVRFRGSHRGFRLVLQPPLVGGP